MASHGGPPSTDAGPTVGPYGAYPEAFAPPPGPDGREHRPGTNGLAIAALCCGIAGLLPVAAVVGIVLGVVALNQLRRVVQNGRGMAVAGIVLGAVWLLGWGALLAIGIASGSSGSGGTSPSPRQSGHQVSVADLKAGDCFDDDSTGEDEEVGDVTVVPCTTAHTSQVITVFDLPAGSYPGKDKVVAAAEKGCRDKGDPLVREDRMDEVEPSFIYPSDAWTWSESRTIQCLADARTGTVTGSVLK
jgi:hypothetical protein